MTEWEPDMKQQRIETLEELLKQPIVKCILSGMIPAVILLFIYMKYGVYPYEKITVMHSDLNGQYVSYLAYLKELLEDGGSFLYSFSKTLGGDFMPILTYYLMSPFNIILLFVSLENIPYALFLIILLKTAGCGLTMFLFLSEKNHYKYYNLLFSTAYALSGYMLMFQTHLMWLDGVILLPLIALGIDRLIEKKKSALYMFSLAASIVICYYTGYMSCIFAVIYFFYRLILGGKEQKAGNRIVKFGVASVCAGGLSAMMLFPAVDALFSTKFINPVVEETKGILWFQPMNLISKFFTSAGNAQEFQDGIPFVFCGILTFALLIQSFTAKSLKLKEKLVNSIIVCIFVISFCVRPIDTIWHGFAVPNDFNHRYSFVFIFFILLIAWRAFSIITEEKSFSIISAIVTWSIMIVAAIFVILQHYTYIDTVTVLLDVAFVSAGILILYFCIRCEADIAGIFLTGFGLLFFVNLYMNGIGLLRDRPYEDTSIRGYVKEVDDTISYIERYDSGLYRMEQDFHYSNNDAMLFSYRGLSHFSSTETLSVINFMGRFGYNQNYNFWAKYGEGATLAGDSLLGMKYFLSREEKPYLEIFHQDATVHTYYNPYALEFGFAVNKEILQPVLWQENAFENQNSIYTAMTGQETDILRTISVKEEIVGIHYSEGEQLWGVDDSAQDSYIRYCFVAQNDNPVYVYLPSNGKEGVLVTVNGEKLTRWLNEENSGILPLESFETGQEVEVLLRPEGNYFEMSNVVFAYLDMEEFQNRIDGLKDNSWYLYESTDTKIEAEVTTQAGEVLFLSIPYDKNWTLYVDGAKTDLIEVMDVFMAAELTEGTHHIVLKYQNTALVLGLFVTILCTFVTIFIIILETRKKKRRVISGELLSAS